MKPFDAAIKSAPRTARNGRLRPTPGAHQCAVMLLETVPVLMRSIRMAMGRLESPTLTVPQFRTLHFVESHVGADLSSTAEFLGLTLPSTSKLVDQLSRRGILQRDHDSKDRRRVMLRLTARGESMLKSARATVGDQLAYMLDSAAPAEIAALRKALETLQASCAENCADATDNARGGNVSEQKERNATPLTLSK